MGLANIGPELLMGMASLFAHKLRSLLTMLGMIFGVGAVVAMLSITAGAQKEMMSFIDQLGVNNITDFLRPLTKGRVKVVAEPIHQGTTQQLWQVIISRADDGKVVARGQVRLQNVSLDRLGP